MDMYSGGGRKLSHEAFLIELSEAKAKIFFEAKFSVDADNVTCTCCGSDFAIWETDNPDFEENGVMVIGIDQIRKEWLQLIE